MLIVRKPFKSLFICFKALKKKTSMDHPDYVDIDEAITFLKGIASHNEASKEITRIMDQEVMKACPVYNNFLLL